MLFLTFSDDDRSDQNQETCAEIEAIIRDKKIHCAAALVQAFLNKSKNPTQTVNYMEIINSYSVDNSKI